MHKGIRGGNCFAEAARNSFLEMKGVFNVKYSTVIDIQLT